MSLRETFSQTVYDSLMVNYDPLLWATVVPTTAEARCDIATMEVAVFTFDLDAFDIAC